MLSVWNSLWGMRNLFLQRHSWRVCSESRDWRGNIPAKLLAQEQPSWTLPAWKSLPGGLDGNCGEKCFQRSGLLFPFCLQAPLWPRDCFRGFFVSFWFFTVWKSQAQEDECKVVYQHGFMEVHRGGKNTLNCYLHMFKSTQIHVAESNGIVKWSQCQQISMDLTPGDGEGIDADAAT